MSDDARRILLSRRARFVAAALAGIGTAGIGACSTKPSVCLEPAYIPEDASKPDGEAGTSDGGKRDDAAAEPQPCLSRAPDSDASDQK